MVELEEMLLIASPTTERIVALSFQPSLPDAHTSQPLVPLNNSSQKFPHTALQGLDQMEDNTVSTLQEVDLVLTSLVQVTRMVSFQHMSRT
jgi:hypothetical protein